MEKYVSKTLTNKNFSTAMASAAEVAERLEGDCTEHAVLLAAMLRAKMIPSRIAVGLVYIEHNHSFGGHMWSEAWLDGKWVPLDATLGRGGIGGAHIKMAQSSFSDDGPAPVLSFLPMMKVLGKMEIKVIESE
jgi:transglutaminase-like putative cysteine protease